MKRAWNFLEVAAGLILLGALALGLAVAFQALSGGGVLGALAKTPQGYPPPQATMLATQPPDGYPPPQETLPVPGLTLLPQPTPIAIATGIFVFPAFTPPPTHPLPPPPTRHSGPTATALPLQQPAKDAAGIIIYLASENNALVSYSLPVDAAGLAQSAPVRMSNNVGVPSSLVYSAPDGSRLAIVNVPEGEGPYSVNILYVDTGRMESVFRKGLNPLGLFFNWHPDSRQVLIRADSNYIDVGLWLVDTDTGEHLTVVVQAHFVSSGALGDIYDGAVSPDGQKVVYSLQKDVFSPGELWMVNEDGSDPRLLFTGATPVELTWSPNGNYIAFLGSEGLVVIEADGSNFRTLSSSHDGYDARAVWSPDSRTLAFNAIERLDMNNDGDADVFNPTIHLVDVITGEERPLLADDSAGSRNPTWSPDGAQIAFISTRGGTSEIWAVNRDGTNLRQLTTAGQSAHSLVWRRP